MGCNAIIDSAFIALRATHFMVFKTLVLNACELFLVIVLFHSGSVGIVIAYAGATLAATSFGIVILQQKFEYRPAVRIDVVTLRRTARFSLANYIVSYFNGLPALALPLIVTAVLGSRSNAVYFIAYSCASILFIVPLGIGSALFAEGVYEIETLRYSIRRAAGLTAGIMIPAVCIVILVAPIMLRFFGSAYSSQGIVVLRVLALSGFFVAIAYPCGSILNALHRLRMLMVVNLVGACVVVLFAYVLLVDGRLGLAGAAWGWLLGWLVYACMYLFAARWALSLSVSTSAGGVVPPPS
jgi:O-antigen/teichoic acid export membrane protein